MRLTKVLGAFGRACVTFGVLTLLFVAYQLWGTGIREAQAQDRLADDFAQVLDGAEATSDVPTSTTNEGDPTTVPAIPAAVEGNPTARIRIPKIGVDKIVVEGVSLTDLKQGPGHFPGTPLPGQEGNAAIAGHRTTYGAPFNRIDELEPGDEIIVQTTQGSFTYLMQEQRIVSPGQVEVLEDKGDNRLTLTACHPKFSARERIVVVAQLAPDEVPRPPAAPSGTEVRPVAIQDIDGDGAPALPAILLAALAGLVWLLAWLAGRRWRRWPAYVVAFPVFMVALFLFFEEFSRLLPSSY